MPSAGVTNFVNFYTGFIWEICYLPGCEIDAPLGPNCGSGYCVNCPSDGTCLINCDWDEYFDNGVCNGCRSDISCPLGCVRPENCNPCFDETCDDCLFWENCTDCIDNATLVDGFCECNPGFFYLISVDECRSCHTNCTNCYGSNMYECTSCDNGFYLQPGTDVCLPTCPTGYTANSITNTCDGVAGQVLCFDFDCVSTSYPTTGSSSSVTGGVSVSAGTSILPAPTNDPVPTYNRGLWFNGNAFMEFTSLKLSSNFTLRMWIRPKQANGVLFSINKNVNTSAGSEDHLSYTVFDGRLTEVRFAFNGSWDVDLQS